MTVTREMSDSPDLSTKSRVPITKVSNTCGFLEQIWMIFYLKLNNTNRILEKA